MLVGLARRTDADIMTGLISFDKTITQFKSSCSVVVGKSEL